MSATAFAIVVFIVATALVAAVILFARNEIALRGSLKVKRSFKRKGEKSGPQRPSKQGSRAGDSQRTAYKSRINIFGMLAAAVFGVLAVRSWSLQVLSGSQYSSQATSNMTSESSVPARRGRILDRNGRELVTNRISRTVVGDNNVVDDSQVVHRLSLVLGIPEQAIRARLNDQTSGATSDKVVASDVSMRAVSYIAENSSLFPGVSVESRTVRSYPYGTLAAHVLGYVGTISEEELAAETEGITYESGDTVGKTGVEAAYESVLQGNKGVKVYQVDSSGNTLGVVDETDPDPGDDIRLTIDVDVQQVAEDALTEGLASARSSGYGNAYCGALVVIDVKTGGVIAMASAPSYDPNEFVNGISESLWDSLTNEDSNYPMNNRAIAGQYPAASTYKAFTGMAGLMSGLVDAGTTAYCSGTWTGFGEEYSQNCWDTTGHGSMDIYYAIAYSCDVYFYELASSFWYQDDRDILSDYLEGWGFGSTTGIDIGGEMSGRVPDSEWKSEYYWETPEEAQWLAGDLTNMSIGQGDVLVTPLQIAVGYAGIATGKMYKPHVLYEVMNKNGQVVIGENISESDFKPDVSEENLAIMRDALRLAVTSGGVSSVFTDFSVEVAAKSGTGETGSSERDDYAWFAAYGPFDDPQYVCVCVLEQGGGGTSSAGPPVRKVMAQLFGLDEEGTVTVAETGER